MAAASDMSTLERWVAAARTRRGATLSIRPLRADDREREVEYLNSLSARSLSQRLFTPLKFLPRHLVELGISVADAWQRCAVASLLIEQLVRYAREQGVQRLTGQVLPDNQAMIALARRSGFAVSYDPAQHLFRISRDLQAPHWRSRVA